MTTEIRVPTIANAGPKLSIGRWFKRVGDLLAVQESLVEIDTDNVTHEVRASVTGVLSKILVKDGATVKPGAICPRHFLADFIICMWEFDFRQAQPLSPACILELEGRRNFLGETVN